MKLTFLPLNSKLGKREELVGFHPFVNRPQAMEASNAKIFKQDSMYRTTALHGEGKQGIPCKCQPGITGEF